MSDKQFHPLQDVPTTDDEARIALRYERSGFTGDVMVSLFNVNRKLGMSLLEAYKETLIASLPKDYLTAPLNDEATQPDRAASR